MVGLVVQPVDLVKPGARRDIHLAADHRFNARLFGGLIKVDRAAHHAMVGDGDRLLPELFDALHEFFNAAGAVEQAVFGM